MSQENVSTGAQSLSSVHSPASEEAKVEDENENITQVESQADEANEADENVYVDANFEDEEFIEGEQERGESLIPEEEEEPFISVFDILDAPKELPEPVDLSLQHLKQIANELGLIKLCWPDIKDVCFEFRTNFPESYLKNTNKEKLLLFYAENFRKQFHHIHPHRKPLFLAADNECRQQVSYYYFFILSIIMVTFTKTCILLY